MTSGAINAPLKIMLTAVEPSADAMGAALLAQLQHKLPPETEYFGCGGALMAAQGFKSAFPIDAFSVMGVSDALKVWPEGQKRTDELASICDDNDIDIVICIDGWLFSKIAAQKIKHRSPGTKLLKYAAPQIWASRPQRVETVHKLFDAVLTLLPFEPALFEAAGVSATFVGNPNFENIPSANSTREQFRECFNLQGNQVLCVLPGSRKSEVQRLCPVFGETLRKVHAAIPSLDIVVPAAPAVAELVTSLTSDWDIKPKLIPADQRFDAFYAADAALAASGTVSTELGLCGTPHIVAYKVDALTWAWAKRVFIADYASILNITAGSEVVPEFIQDDCTPELLGPVLIELLQETQFRDAQKAAFDKLSKQLGITEQKSAAEQASDAIVDFIKLSLA